MEQEITVHVSIKVSFLIEKELDVGAKEQGGIKGVEGKNGLIELTVIPDNKQGRSQNNK